MYVRAQVYPGNKREQIKVIKDNHLEIMVKEPAERNLANKRVRDIIAEHYQVAAGQVRMISGHTSQRKIFSITKV